MGLGIRTNRQKILIPRPLFCSDTETPTSVWIPRPQCMSFIETILFTQIGINYLLHNNQGLSLITINATSIYFERKVFFFQVYFPKDGRKIKIPPLFAEPEALAEVLKKGRDRYLYVLDRNCVQVCQFIILPK